MRHNYIRYRYIIVTLEIAVLTTLIDDSSFIKRGFVRAAHAAIEILQLANDNSNPHIAASKVCDTKFAVASCGVPTHLSERQEIY